MSYPLLNGIPVMVLTPVKHQRRRHKRKRINKKWCKKYGYTVREPLALEKGQVIMVDGKLVMNEQTYSMLKRKL